MAHKELCHTFVHELVDALVKLFLLHRIGIIDILEHLRRERRQALEMQVFAGSKGIANLEITGIGQTDYISGKGFIHRLLFLRHEAGRCRKTHLLVLAYVIIIGVTQEFAAAYLEERDTGAMVRIHVGVDLKAESREFVFHRFDRAFFGCHRERGRGVGY